MKVLHRDATKLGFDYELPPPRSCWPTLTQRLLLQACVGGPELAAAAFAAWHARVDVFRLDLGSNRLMALLYRNLERAGVRAPEHDVLKGNWRYHWYQNKTRMRELAGLQADFAAAGIPVAAMKGVPLMAFYYADLGVRPIADFDLLVPRAQAREAAEWLVARGYHSARGRLDYLFKIGNGGEFVKDGATVLDLHWGVLHDCRAGWSEDEFWAGVRTRRFEGMDLTMLRPEDQILHLCEHGMRWSPLPPLRWLADVAVVVRGEGHRLDTDYLRDAAERRGLLEPVRATFAWLDRHLDFGAANVMRRALPRMRPDLGGRVDHVWRAFSPQGLPGLVPAWVDYRRARIENGRAPEGGFLAFYAARKKIAGRVRAFVDLAIIAVKRLCPWLLARGWDEIKASWDDMANRVGGPAMAERI